MKYNHRLLFITLRILVRVKVISEGEHVRDVALWIVGEGVEVGVHALLVQVVLDVLLLPRATLVAACLLLRLHVPSPWNAIACKTGHVSPSWSRPSRYLKIWREYLCLDLFI